MNTVPLMKSAFQIAYVTNDLDQAAAMMRKHFGTGEFVFFRGLPGALTDIALAYSGTMMIEVLRPLAVSGDFYADHIADADGFVLKHHHFGMFADTRRDIADIRAAHVRNGHSIVYEGENAGAVQYLYADCRKTLGHYLEYIRLEEGGRQMFAAVPGSPFA